MQVCTRIYETNDETRSCFLSIPAYKIIKKKKTKMSHLMSLTRGGNVF